MPFSIYYKLKTPSTLARPLAQPFALFRVIMSLSLLMLVTSNSHGQEDNLEPVHYAYANYLGSGIYRTSGQNASLISMPFSSELGQKGQTSFGLRLPVSIGFFDFAVADIPELELPSAVGTITFTPGIAFQYQYTKQWRIDSYLDFGYAKNFTTGRSVSVYSTGVSGLYDFTIDDYDAVWASRIYYAAFNGNGYDAKDSYAAVQTGIDIGLPFRYQIAGSEFQPRIFASAFWYFSEVDFVGLKRSTLEEQQGITLTNSFEVGFTLKFARKLGYSWAGIDTLGLSYRYNKDISAVRLLFSFPI